MIAPGFQLPQVQPSYNNNGQSSNQYQLRNYNAGQLNNQYQLGNAQQIPGMIDGGPLLSAYGNNLINPSSSLGVSGGFNQQQQQQQTLADTFPYSVDMTNLQNYNQYYANALKRSDQTGSTLSPGGSSQTSNVQNRAVTSLTGYANNNNYANSGNRANVNSLHGYSQSTTTTAMPYTAGLSTTTPTYNQLYNAANTYNYGTGIAGGVNNYNYGGTGVGTGAGATGTSTISSINPYIYKISKRQSYNAPLDLLTSASKKNNRRSKKSRKKQNTIEIDEVYT